MKFGIFLSENVRSVAQFTFTPRTDENNIVSIAIIGLRLQGSPQQEWIEHRSSIFTKQNNGIVVGLENVWLVGCWVEPVRMCGKMGRVRRGARILVACHKIQNLSAGKLDPKGQVGGNIYGNILPKYYR